MVDEETCKFPEGVCAVQGDGARTSITLDFGDGHALTYSNVSSIEEGIKHIYKAVGIYRVTAIGENSLGSETVVLYLHVTCELLRSQESSCFVIVITFSGIAAISLYTVWHVVCFISSQNTLPTHNHTTSQIEQIPLHFHLSPLHRISACEIHSSLICDRVDHPGVFGG